MNNDKLKLLALPSDVLGLILKRLTIKSFGRLLTTCKSLSLIDWNQYYDNNVLFARDQWLQYYPIILGINTLINYSDNERFLQNIKILEQLGVKSNLIVQITQNFIEGIYPRLKIKLNIKDSQDHINIAISDRIYADEPRPDWLEFFPFMGNNKGNNKIKKESYNSSRNKQKFIKVMREQLTKYKISQLDLFINNKEVLIVKS